MINQILDSVRQVWQDLEIDRPVPDHVRYVLQSRSRVILFLFDEGAPDQPLAVVKVARNPADNDQMEQSVRRAQVVRAMLDDVILSTVPTMCLLRPAPSVVALAQKVVPGRPIELSSRTGSREAATETACEAFREWLVRFQYCTGRGCLEMSASVVDGTRWLQTDCWPRVSAEPELLFRGADPIAGLQLDRVWAYGDAHPSNILLDKGKVTGVVDWEATRPNQYPFSDWFQFTFSLAQELVKAQHPSLPRMERALMAYDLSMGVGNSRLQVIFREQTKRFLSAINLPVELARPLFRIFLSDYYHFDGKDLLMERLVAQG